MGCLPSCSAAATAAATTASAVCAAGITSASRMTATGLKKCMPTTRSGRRAAEAIAVTGIDEVFVARSASAAHPPSSVSKIERLMASFSGAASMTRSQAKRSREPLRGAQPRERRLGVGRRESPALRGSAQRRGDPLGAAVGGAVDRIAEHGFDAGARTDLGDARSHRPRTDDTDTANRDRPGHASRSTTIAWP